MKMNHFLMRLLILIVFIGLIGRVDASSMNDGTSSVVLLKGVVRSKTIWGPPGFGETPKLDSKITIYILKLHERRTAKQLQLPDNEKNLGRTFSEVQLRCDSATFLNCEAGLTESVGRKITVGGQTTNATEPTDFLPVILHLHLITNE